MSNAWKAGANDLEFTENEKSNLILFFMLLLRCEIIRALKRIGRFALFSYKNNQERWVESEAYLEPQLNIYGGAFL